MKELVERIEALLSRGCNLLDLVSLQREDGMDVKIYWQIVKLTLDVRLWTLELTHKAGHPIEEAVLAYLLDLLNRVRNQLFILANAGSSS